MEPETEKLLQTWLKIQIWQIRMGIVKWVLILIFTLGFYRFALPVIKMQLNKLDKMQSQLLNLPAGKAGLSEKTEEQAEFFDQFEKGTIDKKSILEMFIK